MKNIIKSWRTTLIGIVIICGIGYYAIANKGIGVQDGIALALAFGLIQAKDGKATHTED